MSTTTPADPPRPTRADGSTSGATLSPSDVPQIPPRPRRTSERQESPHRESFNRSPFNEPPAAFSRPPPQVYEHHGNLSASDLPARPPSVQLPSIGSEGDEYASIEQARASSNSPEQKRNVAQDLPLHQPTASLSQSSAKFRIQTVTRTDSDRAASSSPSKALHDEDHHSEKHSLRVKASFNRSNPSLVTGSRPASSHEPERDETGMPGFGLQVPMYRNAGDVQAPSPAPGHSPYLPAGVSFPIDSSARNHHRRRSSRQDLNPPGSYGMHGHGHEPRDQFEKAWYQKHPEALARELNAPYDPGHPRSEWAMSSEDLNKLVHGANKGVSFATPDVATPDEQTGYRASEEYSSRNGSPKPLSGVPPSKRPSSSHHASAESPLRRASFPFNDGRDSNALETDDEDDAAGIRPKGAGQGRIASPADGTAADAGWHGDVPNRPVSEYNIPILAEDEVARYPSEGYAQPAVDHQPTYDHDLQAFRPSSRRGSDGHSRPSSRPVSMHGEPLSRFISQDRHDASGVGTPLAEIQEYEPLFPDDDKEDPTPKKRTIRPDVLARHHFPSQDIWEDSPDSLSYTATVSTPDLPSQVEPGTGSTESSTVFEHPDKEAQRKNGPIASDRAHFLPKETEAYANPKFKPGVLQDIPTRPGLQPRFPSQDIWEDSPDSLQYETTVTGPQSEETPAEVAPEHSQRPFVPARPAAKTRDGADAEQSQSDRSKPVVPARPSGRSPASEAPAPKPKPAIPARPAGKFSSIKASFMSDLNSRLQLGPQAPKREEPSETSPTLEPAPLADARKSRVKGPARRKPTSALATAETITPADLDSPPEMRFSLSKPRLVFALDGAGVLSTADQTAPANRSSSLESHSALPPAAIGAEGDAPAQSSSSIGTAAAQRHEELQPELATALSGAGAAGSLPEQHHDGDAKSKPAATTPFPGAKALDDGDVVVGGDGGVTEVGPGGEAKAAAAAAGTL